MSTPGTIDSMLSSGTLGSPPAPVVNSTLEPSAVRNGSPAARQAYDEALSFESVLVTQLCQQVAATGGLTGADGRGDSASGGSSSDPTASDFGSLLPGALSSAIMSGGGLGLAAQLYPSLETPTQASAGGPATGAA